MVVEVKIGRGWQGESYHLVPSAEAPVASVACFGDGGELKETWATGESGGGEVQGTGTGTGTVGKPAGGGIERVLEAHAGGMASVELAI